MKTKHVIRFFIAMAIMCTTLSTYAQVDVGLSINIAPPVIPDYQQPPCPGDGYLWTPGYWAYSDSGYYWVPGVWVYPPTIGVLWTPGYWGYEGNYYRWHRGYWGPHVGYYGGVNYGFGYIGFGFAGGIWEGSHFRYNTAVMNVNTTIVHNTYYNRVVINNASRVSFNGPGGVNARPRPEERAAMNEHHFQPTTLQVSHQQTARSNPSQFVNVNHGRPATTAVTTVNSGSFYHRANVSAPANNGAASRPAQNYRPQNNGAVQQQHQQPVQNYRPQNSGAVQQQHQQPAQNYRPQNSSPVQQQQPQQNRPQQNQQQHQQPQQNRPQQNNGGGQPQHQGGGNGGGEHRGERH